MQDIKYGGLTISLEMLVQVFVKQVFVCQKEMF